MNAYMYLGAVLFHCLTSFLHCSLFILPVGSTRLSKMIPYDTCLYLVASIISAVMVAKLVRFLINWTVGFRVSKAAAEQFGGEKKHWLYGNLDVVS